MGSFGAWVCGWSEPNFCMGSAGHVGRQIFGAGQKKKKKKKKKNGIEILV